MQRLRVAYPPDLLDALGRRAEAEGISVPEAARQALARGLDHGRRDGESPYDEAVRLLLERARDGSVTATVNLARLLAKVPPPEKGSGDPDDELAARRRRA